MIEAVRLLTLVPMAWGAWSHRAQWIALGPLVLLLAWCNGLILPRRGSLFSRNPRFPSA